MANIRTELSNNNTIKITFAENRLETVKNFIKFSIIKY